MRTVRELNTLLAAGAIVASVTACNTEGFAGSGDDTAPAKTLAARPFDIKVSSRQGGGALMFRVTGAAVDSVTSTDGTAFMIASAEGDPVATTQVVYTGKWNEGVVATLWIRGADDPVIVLQQAAEGGTFAKVEVSGFAISATAR